MSIPSTLHHQAQFPDGPLVEYVLTELEDKMILHIQIDGAMDSTFDILISTGNNIMLASGYSSEDTLIEPKLIVGNHANFKIQIVAGQIAKYIMQAKNPKDTILTIGSKWFGKGDEAQPEDFDKLMFVLENLGILFGQRVSV